MVKKNHDSNFIDKSKNKSKSILYPEFWEKELFENKVKNRTFSGTWQGFIRDAIREKLLSCSIKVEDL